MTQTVSYRPAVKGDIPRLMELFNSQYARKKNEAYFAWQYFESAWPTVMMCAEIDGRIEGMFGLQRRTLTDGTPIGQAIDLLIAPPLRGRGIFAELGRRAAAIFPELRALCVLPNLNGRNACVSALGWDAIAKIDSLVFDAARRLSTEIEPHPPAVTGEPLLFFWSPEIRAWRFDRHPDYRYETVTGEGNAFSVIKVFQDPVTGRRFGDIVDFQAPLYDVSSLSSLFADATRRLIGLGVESITTWALPHTPLFNVLTALGFEILSQERYFCVKALDPSLARLHDITAWHLVQADAEIY